MGVKSTLLSHILAVLQGELDLQTRAAHLAREEAISEESRAENKYDTHSQEAAYLAEGQAKLATEIIDNLKIYQTFTLPVFQSGDPVGLGALVKLEAGSRQNWYFIGPRGGGIELSHENRAILVLTPQSPLGRQLMGKKTGDTVLLPGRGKPEPHRIASIE